MLYLKPIKFLNAVKLSRPFYKKSLVDLPKEVWLIVCQILVQDFPLKYLNLEVIVPEKWQLVPNLNENI